jgi:CBS domain-containing protein
MYSIVQDLLQFKGKELFVTDPMQLVSDAVQKMNQYNVGALLVMDDDRLIGIFTERDVLTRVVAENRAPTRTRVGEVMTKAVLTVRPSTPVAEIMKLITVHRCRHLPVLNFDGKPIGLVSAGDALRHTIQGLETEVADLTAYISTGSNYAMFA